MWPTPTANLYEVSDVPALLERREECKARQNNGNGFGLTLQQAVAVRMWPTPTADRYSGLQSHGQNAILGSLNPQWVSWLMGYPVDWCDLPDVQPSECPIGSTSSEPSATPSSRRSPKSSDGPS